MANFSWSSLVDLNFYLIWVLEFFKGLELPPKVIFFKHKHELLLATLRYLKRLWWWFLPKHHCRSNSCSSRSGWQLFRELVWLTWTVFWATVRVKAHVCNWKKKLLEAILNLWWILELKLSKNRNWAKHHLNLGSTMIGLCINFLHTWIVGI